MASDQTYSRTTGWLYFLLAIIGLFTNHLWYMINLSPTVTLINLAIGISGLTVARHGGSRSNYIFSLIVGTTLTAWGIVGTLYPSVLTPHPLPIENALHIVTGIWGFYGPGSALLARIPKR